MKRKTLSDLEKRGEKIILKCDCFGYDTAQDYL